jgi:molecular chaperone DnaJ
MAAPSYYDILGLSPEADAEEVKRAYRRMAMARHPDRNPGDPEAARSFRRVVEAYEVLGNPRARAAYDAKRRPARGWGRRMAERAARPAPDVTARVEVAVTPAQAARGVRLTLDLPDGPPCPECGGSGRFSRMLRGCGRCGGTGRIRRRYGPVSEEADCPVCGGGRGRSVVCPRCGGSGTLGGERMGIVDIPPGARDGDVLRLLAGGGVVEAVLRVG